MKSGHLLIYAYHFFSEAIIIFLCMLPIVQFYHLSVPYWSYLVMTSVLCLLYTGMSLKIKNSIVFWFLAPFLIGLFYLNEYAIVPSILLAGFLTWRFVCIRGELNPNHGMQNLLLTAVIAMLMLTVFKDFAILIYLLLQFMVVSFGSLGSNVAFQKAYRQFDFTLAGCYIGTLVGGGLLALWLARRQVFANAWDGIVYIGALMVGKVVGLFQFLEDAKLALPGSSTKGGELSKAELLKQTPSIFEQLRPILPVLWAITGALIIAGIVILFMVFKRDDNRFSEMQTVVQTHDYRQPDKQKASIRKKWHIITPTHPIRKEMFWLERNARKKGLGRRTFETLTEWINRNGWELDATSYEKVRYGEGNLDEQEWIAFQRQLKNVKEAVKKVGKSMGKDDRQTR